MPGNPLVLEDYLDAITTAVAAVPGVGSAKRYQLVEETDTSPIVLVDAVAFDSLPELGSGEWNTEVTLELTVLGSKAARGSKLDAMALAHALATACRWSTGGLPVGPAMPRHVARDDASELADHWEVVVVELVQQVVWWTSPEAADPAVTAILLGRDPDIGTGHEADYVEVVPGD